MEEWVGTSVNRINPDHVTAELCRRSLFRFVRVFWSSLTPDEPHYNWHIPYLCGELEEVAGRVANDQPKKYDLIINIPPGTTKSTLCSVMFPIWCWLRWPWLRFITLSYSGTLSLELAEKSRDLMRTALFTRLFPHLRIKKDKEKKSNFQIQERVEPLDHYDGDEAYWKNAGGRYSTSVGSTITGFHGDIVLLDDPINPEQAASPAQLKRTNYWIKETLPTRTTNKNRTPFITIMQRLHEEDPSGIKLDQPRIKHICLPGEIYSEAGTHRARDLVKPPSLLKNYVDDLLDPVRLPRETLEGLYRNLGEYGYASQILQSPVPLGGMLFKVENFVEVPSVPDLKVLETVRYWDKAATTEKESSDAKYTVGVKMSKLRGDIFIITNVVRGRWSTDAREAVIKQTARLDGESVIVIMEQEPGSGGKDSMRSSIKNLAGFRVRPDVVQSRGSKIIRADPYSVQVNNRNVLLLAGEWVRDFKAEHMMFPFGRYKDQVDAAAGAFNYLARVKEAGALVH
jgi:predicted phage terminase large subunit-like protein